MTARARPARVSDGTIKLQVTSSPLVIRVTADPLLRDRNPVAAAFQGRVFVMYDCRTVQPRRSSPPGQPGGSYQAEVLLRTSESTIWAENDLRADPVTLVTELLNDRPKEFEAKLSRPLPVGVAVTESTGPEPGADPHAFMRQPQGQKPRMVVFGDASFASNRVLQQDDDSYALVASTLAWLRERPANIGIEAKKRDVYELDKNTNVSRMVQLPFYLMGLGVIGLGLGVWVVRRR
jgi:hypothetical protein